MGPLGRSQSPAVIRRSHGLFRISEAVPDVAHEPLLLSLKDAGRMLGGISAASVRRIIRDGDLHPVRIRGRIFIAMAELKALVEKQLPRVQDNSCAGRDVPEGEDTCRSASPTDGTGRPGTLAGPARR